MNSRSLAALRRCREFGFFGRVLGSLCATAVLAFVGFPGDVRCFSPLVSTGEAHVFFHLKVIFTPWISTEYRFPSVPRARARRTSFHARLPSHLLLGVLRVSACAPGVAEPSDIFEFATHSSLVRSHQSTCEGSFGPVPPPEQT